MPQTGNGFKYLVTSSSVIMSHSKVVPDLVGHHEDGGEAG